MATRTDLDFPKSEALRQLFVSGNDVRHLRENRRHFNAHERIVRSGISKEFDALNFGPSGSSVGSPNI
jgi:hypothetical protein